MQLGRGLFCCLLIFLGGCIEIMCWTSRPTRTSRRSHRRTMVSKNRLLAESVTADRADKGSSHITSLAGDYSIVVSCDSERYFWSLFPIHNVVEGMDITSEGAQAMSALQSSSTTSSLAPTTTLSCDVSDVGSLRVSLSTPKDAQIDIKLLDVIQRIFVQWVSKQSDAAMDGECEVILHQETEGLSIDLSSPTAAIALFSGISDTSSEVEWVEMVTGSGCVLGKVPRKLVHTFNLLHRGIGLFVSKGHPMNPTADAGFPDLYVHRRSATKRIFPSLYDMFVGGVSLADEPPELTARREVAEELGLSRALDETNATLDPILTCTVCTAYNRCVVTLFGYTMHFDKETVTWQVEEVDWGGFVPYDVIVTAADRSIDRLAETKTWPGTYPPIQSARKGSKTDGITYYGNEDWDKWDFVPDGLLVWEAWLNYLESLPKPSS